MMTRHLTCILLGDQYILDSTTSSMGRHRSKYVYESKFSSTAAQTKRTKFAQRAYLTGAKKTNQRHHQSVIAGPPRILLSQLLHMYIDVLFFAACLSHEQAQPAPDTARKLF